MPTHSLTIHSSNDDLIAGDYDHQALNDDSNHSTFLVSSSKKQQEQQIIDNALTSGCKKSMKTKKEGVTFEIEKNNKVYEIVHINDLRDEVDTKMIWYTKEEYDIIFDRCLEIIEHYLLQLKNDLEGGGRDLKEDDDDHDEEEWSCLRGLELEMESILMKSSHNYNPRRRRRILNAVDAVLREQDEQEIEGIYDDELLAYVCLESSRASHMEAALIGLDDWKEALLLQ